MTDFGASFRCTFCGAPSAIRAATFLGGGGIPKCPCQDYIECADCGVRFQSDYAWVRHCVDDHSDAPALPAGQMTGGSSERSAGTSAVQR